MLNFIIKYFKSDTVLKLINSSLLLCNALCISYRDMVTGGECSYDEETGMPDENCVFVPDGDNSGVVSSMMAAPFLETTTYFCEDADELVFHRSFLPNRQNDLCDFQSAWQVVSVNADFKGADHFEISSGIHC